MTNKARSHLATARLQFDKGQYKDCLRICQSTYQRDPSDAENLLLICACHFQLRQYEEATFYGQQAVDVDPACVEALVVIGNGLKELGQPANAVDLYNKALRLQPRFAHPYAALGCLMLEKNNSPKEAIGCFEMASSLSSLVDPTFRINLGLAFIAIGDTDTAKAHLLTQSKTSAIACLSLGNISHYQGDFDAAIIHYSQALKLEPSFLDAATNLCGSQIESFKVTNDRNMLLQATSRMEQIIASFKNSQYAYARLGLCHKLEGRYTQAYRYFWHAITLDSGNPDTMCNLAALHIETGNSKQAVKLCLRALEFNPTHAQAFSCLGLALFQQMGAENDALECLITAEKLKSSADICCSLGSIFNEMGDAPAAAKFLKKAIALDPSESIPAFLNFGNTYFDHGSLEYAEKCYQNSINSKSVHSAVARSNLMLLNFSQGRFAATAKS